VVDQQRLRYLPEARVKVLSEPRRQTMPDKFRNKRKSERVAKGAEKHEHANEQIPHGGMGGEFPEQDHVPHGGMGGEYPEGHSEDN
jgi:hypothetical protein